MSAFIEYSLAGLSSLAMLAFAYYAVFRPVRYREEDRHAVIRDLLKEQAEQDRKAELD